LLKPVIDLGGMNAAAHCSIQIISVSYSQPVIVCSLLSNRSTFTIY